GAGRGGGPGGRAARFQRRRPSSARRAASSAERDEALPYGAPTRYAPPAGGVPPTISQYSPTHSLQIATPEPIGPSIRRSTRSCALPQKEQRSAASDGAGVVALSGIVGAGGVGTSGRGAGGPATATWSRRPKPSRCCRQYGSSSESTRTPPRPV